MCEQDKYKENRLQLVTWAEMWQALLSQFYLTFSQIFSVVSYKNKIKIAEQIWANRGLGWRFLNETNVKALIPNTDQLES